MDRFANISAFISVAELKSFAAAAKNLGIANSVVSKRISDLEADLGTRLFQRTTRQVTLTDAGYLYFDHARKIIGELAEVEGQLRFANENPVGELRVSAPVTFGTRFLGPAVADYLDKYPGVSLRLLLGDRSTSLIDDGIDLAIRIGPVESGSIISRKLAHSRRVTVASPAYLAKHGRPQNPRDLGKHNCLIYTGVNEGKSWPYMLDGKKINQPVTGRMTSDNGTLLGQAAAHDCGITMLPSFIVAEDIGAGRLEIVLEDYEEEPLLIHAVYLQQRHLSARTRKFIDHLVSYFAGFNA